MSDRVPIVLDALCGQLSNPYEVGRPVLSSRLGRTIVRGSGIGAAAMVVTAGLSFIGSPQASADDLFDDGFGSDGFILAGYDGGGQAGSEDLGSGSGGATSGSGDEFEGDEFEGGGFDSGGGDFGRGLGGATSGSDAADTFIPRTPAPLTWPEEVPIEVENSAAPAPVPWTETLGASTVALAAPTQIPTPTASPVFAVSPEIGSVSTTGFVVDNVPPIETDVTAPPNIATAPVGPAPVPVVTSPGSQGLDLGLGYLPQIAGANIPPRSASLPVSCNVSNVGPSASPEAASQSAKEQCNGQISEVARRAARDIAVDANLAAQAAGRAERYQGVFTCDVPVRAAWTRSPVLPFLYFASASGRGNCILNAVPR